MQRKEVEKMGKVNMHNCLYIFESQSVIEQSKQESNNQKFSDQVILVGLYVGKYIKNRFYAFSNKRKT